MDGKIDEFATVSGGRAGAVERPDAIARRGRQDPADPADLVNTERPSEPLQPDPPLLREQALKQEADGALGRPIAHLPISWIWALTIAVLAISGAMIVLSMQNFERIATAPGVLRPVGGEAQVYSSPGLVVEQILVREGEEVTKGQPLLVLSNEIGSEGGSTLSTNLLESLAEQEALLERQLTSVDGDIQARELEMVASEQELVANLAAAEASYVEANSRLAMAEEDLSVAKPIAERGFVSANAMRQRELAVINMRQLAREELGRIEALRARIARQRATAGRLPLARLNERAVVSSQLEELRQRREQIRAGSLREIRAPVAGKVSALQASVGRTTVPTQPLLYIVPENTQLEAVLYIPSRDIGFVRPGQAIRLRYHAYPYQRHGAFKATVRHVSSTAIRPEEISGPVAIQEPAFRVVANVPGNTIDAYGEKQKLSSGLVFDADIVIEDRSFIEWITEPFRALRGST